MQRVNVPANRYQTCAPRVLVVDNEGECQELGIHVRTALNLALDVAQNADQALKQHRARPYDLVFLGSGLQRRDVDLITCRLRKQDCSPRRTPVVALVAEEQWNSCMQPGVDDVLLKPLSLQAVEAILVQWVPSIMGDGGRNASGSSSLEAVRAVFGNHFNELISLYQATTPGRISALSEARHDPHAIARIAHLLAGSSASIGASRLAAISRQLERQAKQKNVDVFPAHLAAIEAEYQQLVRQLRQLLPED